METFKVGDLLEAKLNIIALSVGDYWEVIDTVPDMVRVERGNVTLIFSNEEAEVCFGKSPIQVGDCVEINQHLDTDIHRAIVRVQKIELADEYGVDRLSFNTGDWGISVALAYANPVSEPELEEGDIVRVKFNDSYACRVPGEYFVGGDTFEVKRVEGSNVIHECPGESGNFDQYIGKNEVSFLYRPASKRELSPEAKRASELLEKLPTEFIERYLDARNHQHYLDDSLGEASVRFEARVEELKSSISDTEADLQSLMRELEDYVQ